MKELLQSVFFPTMNEALRRIDVDGVKLAHYTTYETALKIIDGGVVWMRDARNMNDIGEVRHGIEAMDAFLSDPTNIARIAVLDEIHQGLSHQVLPLWARMRSLIMGEVYITCFSEHWPKEKNFGRLSMWRAYCSAPDGVAIVLNTAPFRLETNALNAYSSPVFYGDAAAFSARFHEVLDNIQAEMANLRAVPVGDLLNVLAIMMLFGAVCLKHPGFKEEEEWRVIYMPAIVAPSLLQPLTAGAEKVFAIPLKDDAEKGLVGIEPDALIDSIIIGPSNRTSAIRDGLVTALSAKGVTDPAARITASGIPLRV